MLDTLARMVSGKPYAWFWAIFTGFFFLFDIMTGHIIFGVLMGALAIYWAYVLYSIYNGTHVAYNRYHGKKG